MGSGGQSLTALGSSGINNSTAGFGAHTGTKTMSSLTFYIAWLKCSFTHRLHPLVGVFYKKEWATPRYHVETLCKLINIACRTDRRERVKFKICKIKQLTIDGWTCQIFSCDNIRVRLNELRCYARLRMVYTG